MVDYVDTILNMPVCELRAITKANLFWRIN